MKFQHPILRRLAGFGISTFARNWMSTLDFKAAFYDERVERLEFWMRRGRQVLPILQKFLGQ